MKKSIALLICTVLTALFVFCSRDKEPLPPQAQITQPADTLTVASFNIQFLGSFKKRDDNALAFILKDYDIVVVQELVSAPFDGTYPDGTSYSADTEAAEFFNAMGALGFSYILSEEDTGTGDKIHTKATSTEWFVTFYKQEKVSVAKDLPHGFLALDRSNHENYERVPFAFPFRSNNQNLDFVLISVHLQPGDRADEEARRKHELNSIAQWIESNNEQEKDIIILGDMNIYNPEELADVTPPGYLSLNDECRITNTLATAGGGRPYDHVMYNTTFSANEIDLTYDLIVIDLVDVMRPFWTSTEPYPGDPYDHNLFKQYYSDHHPVVFKMIAGAKDDD